MMGSEWNRRQKDPLYTLIEFAKFGVETVSMTKTCNFDSNIIDFNSVDLKRPKNYQRPKTISKAKNFNFIIFSLISVSLHFADNYSGKVIGLIKKVIEAAKRP